MEISLLHTAIGLGILRLGLSMFSDAPWLVVMLPASFLLMWISARKSIAVPRMHRSDFTPGPDAEGKAKRIVLILTLSGTGLLMLGLLPTE